MMDAWAERLAATSTLIRTARTVMPVRGQIYAQVERVLQGVVARGTVGKFVPMRIFSTCSP